MTDNQTTELLPCPWCGKRQAIHKEFGGWILNTTSHDRKCIMRKLLSFGMGGGLVFTSKAEAITAWNTRATLGVQTASVAEKIEELRGTALKFPPNIRRKVNIALNGIEQAIADELNAELGSGTCEMEQLIRDMHRECTVCGYSCCTDNGECGIIQRIRKLGIEVDA